MSNCAKVQGDGFHRISDLVNDLLKTSQPDEKNDSDLCPVQSGFCMLDNIICGFQPSDFIVIASRPSVGKSTLALNIASHVAVEQKIPVAFFSLEMSKQLLTKRLLYTYREGQESIPPCRNVPRNDLLRFAEHVRQAPLFVEDSAIVTVDDIRDNVLALKTETGKIGLIIIDYFQLIHPTTVYPDRVPEHREMSRRLKYLAREMACPVIALSQLSRAVEARANKRPLLRDLSESGSLAEDADIVMFIYRDSYYYPESEQPDNAELIVAKNRRGPTGTIELLFKQAVGRFENKSM